MRSAISKDYQATMTSPQFSRTQRVSTAPSPQAGPCSVLIATSRGVPPLGPACGRRSDRAPARRRADALFFAVEQGAACAARDAHGPLLAVISVGSYALAYAHASRRWRGPAARARRHRWTATNVVFYAHPIHAFPGLVHSCRECALAHWLMPRRRADPSGCAATMDLTLRMSAAAALVLASRRQQLARPSLSGLLASFPLATTILVAFTHAQRGRRGWSRSSGLPAVLPIFGSAA